MKRKLLIAIATLSLMGFTTLGIANVKHNHQRIELQEVQLQDKSAEIKQLQLQYEHLNVELDNADSNNKEQIEKLQKEKEHLESEKRRLEGELQAKRDKQEAERLALQRATEFNSTKVLAAGACGDNFYANYIYQKESGCRTGAINSSSGACGIGQALPCSKLPCSLSDYDCQNKWFTNYALSRYGSWEAAYNFWQSHSWW